MSDFSALISAKLDTNGFKTQVDNAGKNTPITFSNIVINQSSLTTAVQNALNKTQFTIGNITIPSLNIQMQKQGQAAGKEFSAAITGSLNSINFKNNGAVNKFKDTLKEVNTALKTNGINTSISSIEAKYQSLANTGHTSLTKIQQGIRILNELQNRMAASANDNSMVAYYQRFNRVLEITKNNLKIVSNNNKSFVGANEINGHISKMQTWLNNNTKANKAYGSQINGYISDLQKMKVAGGAARSEVDKIVTSFKNVTVSAKTAGLSGKSFGDKLKGAFSSISRYISASTLIYSGISAIRNGINDIIELDTALVDLRKTTDGTVVQLKEFYYTANDTAKQLGVTTKDVIQAAAEWSRLGYSIKDAETMAETSSVFKSISPGMDMENATDGLVSAMKAFDIEAEDALDGIASKINAIGNSQAVSNNDIVNFLTRSSSAMAEANNSLEDTIALGTAATEITRDAASVGNALKTISMRIRGYDEETEEYIGGIEVLSGEIANLTKTASNPGGVSLFTDDTKTTYKSTLELLRDISSVYDELTDKQQAGLLEVLAGKRQGQIVAAMINNFGTVEKSIETMKNSAGSAMNEMGIIEERLSFKLNKLKETAKGTFQNLFERDGLNEVIDILTDLLEFIDKFTEKVGILGTTLATVGIVNGIRSLA